MYYFTKWDVLIVDDEPDVLALSNLVFLPVEIYGLPLVLHTARSKAEAIALLHENLDPAVNFAVAFIDVVMETDTAGLELCEYIREEIGNGLIQIFIRTGQPALVPERAVIDRFEINGYFTKMEASEEKLYSLVKSGVRQFLSSHMAHLYQAGIYDVISASDWRKKITQLLVNFWESIAGAPTDIPLYVSFDQTVEIRQSITEQQIALWRQQLMEKEGLRFNPSGDTYFRDPHDLWGIHIVATSNNAEVLLLCQTAFAAPEDLIAMTHRFFLGLATLWKRNA